MMTDFPVHLIQTDFKRLEPGDWFFPMTLKGVNQHSLLSEAVEKGISGFAFENGQAIPPTDRPMVQVSNLREFLFSLAEKKRACLPTTIAVITGSNGKTSVKELIGAILRASSKFSLHVSPENQNTNTALATQILRLPVDTNLAVFEMGANKVGDFAQPLQFLKPNIVALLNIGTAHVGEFGSPESLFQEKISALSSDTAQTLVVASDNALILKKALQTRKRVISFGYVQSASQSLCHVQIQNESEHSVELSINGQVSTFECGFQSPARALNVAAAVALGFAFDIPLQQIQKAICEFSGVSRRFQVSQWDGMQAIDDAFNASPESLKAGLELLEKLFSNQRILLVLGSMLELGSASPAKHREAAHLIWNLFGNSIQSRRLSLITVGDEAQIIAEEARELGFSSDQVISFANSQEAKPQILAMKNQFEVVYLKGSKSIGLQEILSRP